MRSALIWNPAFTSYRFRPDHPFNPTRLELATSLIEAMGLIDGADHRVVEPRMATEEELLRVHTPAYLDAVRRLSEQGARAADGARWGLDTEDTPIFAGMHEATATVVGGTIMAAEMVMRGEVERSFAIAGGLHHAHREQASGFCVYSDLGAAIAWMREEFDARVLYIDNDGHHGDGVQGLFYDDPEVLTLSIHESGRYLFPGTGFADELGEGDGYGYSVNLPLEPQTEDDSWISVYGDLVNEVADAFQPDVIVLQFGCDAHLYDPLTHLRCTTRMFEETMRITTEVADRVCRGKIIATGGGGYAVWRVVPRAWTLAWAVLSGQEFDEKIPVEWLNEWQGRSPVLLPEQMHDEPDAFPPVPRRAEVEAMNRRALDAVRRTALPLIRGWGLGF